MEMVQTSIMKALLDKANATGKVLIIQDMSGELDNSLARSVAELAGLNTMFLGNSTWGFSEQDSVDVYNGSLCVLDYSYYPLAVIFDRDSVFYDVMIAFFNLAAHLAEHELEFSDHEEYAESPVFDDFKNIYEFSPILYNEFVEILSQPDNEPLTLILNNLGFDPEEFCSILGKEFITLVSDEPVTSAYGLELPSSEILKASEDFKQKIAELDFVRNLTVDWGDTKVSATVSVIDPADANLHGIFVEVHGTTFRLYSGVKMSFHLNQPGLTLAVRINSDKSWVYDNLVRSTCFNVSPYHAISELIEYQLGEDSKNSELRANWTRAVFQCFAELGFCYNQTLADFEQYEKSVSYEDHWKNFEYTAESDSV